MRKVFASVVIYLICHSLVAQSTTYTLVDLERIFLTNNLQLIAQKYAINQSEAQIIQEKVWQNPTLSISEFNFWKTYDIEEQALLFGQYGRSQQISVDLEQVIETAGKRVKRVELRKLEAKNELLEYEDLLVELRSELRMNFFKLQQMVALEKQLNRTYVSLQEIQNKQQNLAESQLVSKADFYRIQSEVLKFKNELFKIQNEQAKALSMLQILTNLPELTADKITFKLTNSFRAAFPINALEIAKENNIDYLRLQNNSAIATQQLKLARAERNPDLAIQAKYDRGGNIMKDFVGFGLSFDLPIFNQNKGNIIAAKYAIEEQKALQILTEKTIENSIQYYLDQLQRLEANLNDWPTDLLNEQHAILDAYLSQFQKKQISLMQLLDYINAFLQTNEAYYETLQNYYQTLEEFKKIIGKDF